MSEPIRRVKTTKVSFSLPHNMAAWLREEGKKKIGGASAVVRDIISAEINTPAGMVSWQTITARQIGGPGWQKRGSQLNESPPAPPPAPGPAVTAPYKIGKKP